jgi:signal transduction histidine kinase
MRGGLLPVEWHTAVAVFALVVVLLVDRFQRNQMKRALAEGIKFDTLLSYVLREFAHGEPEDLPGTLTRVLRHLAADVGVDRVSLVHFSESHLSRSVQRTLQEDHATEDRFLSVPTYPTADFPAAVASLARGETVTFSSLAEQSPVLASDRGSFAQVGLESLLALPVSSDGGVLGALVVATIGRRRAWSDTLVKRLRAIADVLSGVLVREDAVYSARRNAAVSAAFLEATGNLVVLVDGAGVIRQVNEAWIQWAMDHGVAQISAVSPGASYVDECRRAIARGDVSAGVALNAIEQVLAGRQSRFALQYRLAGPGAGRWFDMRIEALRAPDGGAVISHVDITAQHDVRRHSEEIAHLARIGTMGQFAASLAHELSQPLSAILSNAQAARRFLGAPRPHLPEIRAILEDIDADDQRAGDVIRRMRALFTRHEVEFVTLDVNAVVREVLALVHSEAVLRRVTVVLDLADTLGLVAGDRVQVQQILLNLILNAFEAMTGPGAESGERRLILHTALNGDGDAEISVRDTGPGIPPPILDRLFESFFTTKREGLGMGLSIARTIAQNHGGRLWAANNSDYGATFHLALPLVARTSV